VQSGLRKNGAGKNGMGINGTKNGMLMLNLSKTPTSHPPT